MKTISFRSVLFCAASLFISLISFAQASITSIATNQSKIISERETIKKIVTLNSAIKAKKAMHAGLVLVRK